MKARIVRIGNTQGIRNRKPLLEQSGIGGEVELELREDQLIHPARQPRAGWDVAFREMAERGDDILLDVEVGSTTWDAEELEW